MSRPVTGLILAIALLVFGLISITLRGVPAHILPEGSIVRACTICPDTKGIRAMIFAVPGLILNKPSRVPTQMLPALSICITLAAVPGIFGILA